MRTLALVALLLVVPATADAHLLRFAVPAHQRVVKQIKRPASKTVTRWRIRVNGTALRVGGCFKQGAVCFMYGSGVVVRLTDYRVAVSSERARTVHIKIRYVFR